MAKGKRNKKARIKRFLLQLTCVVLSLILVALIGVAYYADYLLGLVGYYDPNEESIYSPEQAAGMTEETDAVADDFTGGIFDDLQVSVAGSVPAEVLAAKENVVNILLIGQDRRAGEGRQRSDSMILCTFNKANNTVTLVSFMRDLYVEIPGYWATRMNAAYAWGGMPLLKETILHNFGVEVDGCVEVDFGGFEDIIDLLGGVDITLTEKEAAYFQKKGYNVSVGSNHMDGALALEFSRLRAIDSDFGRTRRQRDVLTAIFDQYKSLSLTEMTSMLEKLLPMVATDMSTSQMVSCLTECFPVIAAGNLNAMRIPADGLYEDAYVNKQAVLVADMDANRQLLYDMLLGK